MHYRALALLAAFVVAGCASARPAEPLELHYPQMMSSTATEGVLAATMQVGRGGEVKSVRVDAAPGVHELFSTSLRRDLELLRFKPARALGIARASTVAYTFRYALVAERTATCPPPRDEREIVICSVFSAATRERTY